MSDVERQIAAFRRRMDRMKPGLEDVILSVHQQNATELADAVRQLAAEHSITGELVGSIKASGPGETTPAYSMGGARALNPLEYAVTEGNDVVRHAAHVEFGTAHADAQPHFFPAVRLLWKKHKRRRDARVRTFLKDTSA